MGVARWGLILLRGMTRGGYGDLKRHFDVSRLAQMEDKQLELVMTWSESQSERTECLTGH